MGVVSVNNYTPFVPSICSIESGTVFVTEKNGRIIHFCILLHFLFLIDVFQRKHQDRPRVFNHFSQNLTILFDTFSHPQRLKCQKTEFFFISSLLIQKTNLISTSESSMIFNKLLHSSGVTAQQFNNFQCDFNFFKQSINYLFIYIITNITFLFMRPISQFSNSQYS